MEDKRELAKEEKGEKKLKTIKKNHPQNDCTILTECMIRCCKLMFYLYFKKVSS